MCDTSPKSEAECLKKVGVDPKCIAARYRYVLRLLHTFINAKKIAGCVEVDHKLLKRAVCDYFVDIGRKNCFHGITEPNAEKSDAYLAYWLLKRKPLKIKTDFSDSEFINELFVAAFIITSIIDERKINADMIAKNAKFKDFQEHLYFTLKYRHISQQSFELMFAAFFCGFDFTGYYR